MYQDYFCYGCDWPVYRCKVDAVWMVEAGVGCVGSEPKLSIMGRVTTGPVEATLSTITTPARQPNIASTAHRST